MARRSGTLRILALTLVAGGALAAAAGGAEAQGKGRKLGHYKEKHVQREYRRDARVAVPRYDDRRYDPRDDERYGGYARSDDRYAPTRRAPVYARSVGPTRVPPGHLPPPGLCRIWIDGVPPGRQPRATDCATAHRYRPANARVLYGGRARDRRSDDWSDDRRYDDRYYGDDRYRGTIEGVLGGALQRFRLPL